MIERKPLKGLRAAVLAAPPPIATNVHRLSIEAPAMSLLFFDDCRAAVAARYLMKGVLAEGATSSIFGPPKSLKSTLAADMGVHVAAGRDWRGYRVREPRGVVYFGFERAGQVRKALAAYAVRDGIDSLPFAVAGKLIDMLDPGCVNMIVVTIRAAEARFGMPVGLAIFDTWAKGIAAGGGSEDKAEHQNLAAANVRKVIEALPSLHCMTIGHTGKDVAKGERGSNATQGDRDVGIVIEGKDRVRKASIAYANDLPDGELTAFEGEEIVVGVDEDGESTTAFIVSRRTVTPAPARRTSPKESLALNALDQAMRDHGELAPAGSDLPPVRVVAVEHWREELFRCGVIDQSAKNPREPFRRLKISLIQNGILVERDGFIWRADSGLLPPPLPPG
ncbi:AAA family ATPase [Bauldia litoralis]|uniref:AAA family ATPase n=1 Tax=Bauldia litoralis TaxID=665467 RepID=UPI00326370D7